MIRLSYSDDLNNLVQSQYISYVIILDPNGAVYWTNNENWQVNGSDVLRQWMGSAPSLNIAGTKYSSFRNEPGVSFVGRNMAGGGLVVLQQSPNGYVFLTWTSHEFLTSSGLPPLNIHAEVARMASKFK